MEKYEMKVMTDIKPREKLLERGESALTDSELLSIILQTGVKGKNVYSLAKDLDGFIKAHDGSISYTGLRKFTGMGDAKTLKILACIEYSKRYKAIQSKRIESASDIYKLVHNITDKRQEYFILITLNGSAALIKRRGLFIGTMNKTLVHPREIFAYALRDRAASVIFVHNHPSGSLEPSEDDINMTRKLKIVGEIMDIAVLDHVIVTKNDYYSFSVNNML